MTQKEETKNIGASSGQREAPAGLLLLIAEALATNKFWWLMSPEEREEGGAFCEEPLRNMHGIEEVNYRFWYGIYSDRRLEQYAPAISFDLPRMKWEDFKNGRWVSISVPDGAETGIIEWDSGTGESSSLLASILCLLPDWENDGAVAARIAAIDREEAIRIIEGGLPINHFGGDYRPRRSWNLQGVEIRYANWLDDKGIEALFKKLRAEGYRKKDPVILAVDDSVEVVHRQRS